MRRVGPRNGALLDVLDLRTKSMRGALATKFLGLTLELPPLELMKKAQEHRRLQTAIKQSEARWLGSSRLPIQRVTTGQSTECRTG